MIISNISLSCTGASCASSSSSFSSPGPPSPGGGGGGGGSLGPTGLVVVAACLGVIGTLGLLNNLLVLTLFLLYRPLRSPINLLLVSISLSDLLVSLLATPLSFSSSTQGRWLSGAGGCVWYGFVNAYLGIVSLVSLAVLSYERCCTMLGPVPASSQDYGPALAGICFSWLYAGVWTVPPLLGWSRYGPEVPGTTCSVDWGSRTPGSVSYVACLFVFCLAAPFSVILYSYGRLVIAIRQVSSVSSVMSRRREQRVLLMVIVMVGCYMVCWLPYGVAALLATFGPPGLLTPEVRVVPSLLAKSSTAINPIIYIFMNRQFYRCLKAFLSCSALQQGSSFKTSSRATKTVRTTPRHGVHVPAAATTAPPKPSSANPSSAEESSNHVAPPPDPAPTQEAPPSAQTPPPKPKLTLVTHYRV